MRASIFDQRPLDDSVYHDIPRESNVVKMDGPIGAPLPRTCRRLDRRATLVLRWSWAGEREVCALQASFTTMTAAAAARWARGPTSFVRCIWCAGGAPAARTGNLPTDGQMISGCCPQSDVGTSRVSTSVLASFAAQVSKNAAPCPAPSP